MDDRMAHVRALVAERWRAARERRQRNDLQARRVEALERFLHGELLASSTAKSVEIAVLKKEIAEEAAAEETYSLKLATLEVTRDRLQTRCWTGQRQVEYLKEVLKDQQAESSAMWAEMMSDRDLLREDDAARAEIEREARREGELLTEKLQQELVELEKAIAAKKILKVESEKAKYCVESLKYRKRTLEGELETANADNKSLKTKIAKLRGPKHAAIVEEGIDAILRELDEMDMPHLEFGDKVVLPAKVLLELECFKVATPMLFHIRAFGAKNEDSIPGFTQYCSVQEFSAPDGQVFIPYWMMENLRLSEGSDVVITNVMSIPRGIYCRLQPEDASFLDIAAEIGPKLLMESALRRYSVMSVNETIVIDHGDKRFHVKVLELKPNNAVSLLGDVDLDMDFAAPLRADPKRPKSAAEKAAAEELRLDGKPRNDHHQQDLGSLSHLSTTIETVLVPLSLGHGRRLGDGECVTVSEPASRAVTESTTKKNAKLGLSSFKAAKLRTQAACSSAAVLTDRVAACADTDSLAKDIKLAQAAFSSEGHRLGGRVVDSKPVAGSIAATGCTTSSQQESSSSNQSIANRFAQVCEMCLAEISPTNMTLHAVRCSRNPSYHKFECSVCQEKVSKRNQQAHLHCSQCNLLHTSEIELASHIDAAHAPTRGCVDFGERIPQMNIEHHRQHSCPQELELCQLCGFKLKRKEMPNHILACSSRTEKCEVCLKYIKIVDLDAHSVACASDREPSNRPHHLPSNNQLEENGPVPRSKLLECVYCTKRTFADNRQLERHVNQECLTARQFLAPVSAKPSTDAPATTVKTLIQGKLKRREDAQILSESASTLTFDTRLLNLRRAGNQRESLPSRSLDPLVGAISSDRHTSLTQTTTRRHRPSHKQPARPPAQLTSLPITPSQPKLEQLDSAPGMVVGNAVAATTIQPRAQANARGSGTQKLQVIRRQ